MDDLLQWFRALDVQVIGVCRADERLKPLLKINAFTGAAEDRLLSHLSQNDSVPIENLGTPTSENVSYLTHTKKLDGSSQVGMGISVSTSNLPWGEPESAAPSIRRYLKESTFWENAVNSLPQGASMKEFEIIGRERIDVHNAVDVSASTPNQLKSPRKRRNEILYLEDSEHQNEVPVQQRNPKLLKIVGNDSLTLQGPNKDHGETVTLAHSLKHLVDVHSKFLEDIEKLVPSSMYKLQFSVVPKYFHLYNSR